MCTCYVCQRVYLYVHMCVRAGEFVLCRDHTEGEQAQSLFQMNEVVPTHKRLPNVLEVMLPGRQEG